MDQYDICLISLSFVSLSPLYPLYSADSTESVRWFHIIDCTLDTLLKCYYSAFLPVRGGDQCYISPAMVSIWWTVASEVFPAPPIELPYRYLVPILVCA